MLEDAVLVLGLWRHLSAYQVSAHRAALGDLEHVGKVYEMAWRLRGSGLSSAERVRAIGIEAKLAPLELKQMVLPTLETLGWVKLNRDRDGKMISVEALIPPPGELVAGAQKLFEVASPSAVELACLELLRVTSRLPLERDAAIDMAAGHGEEAAVEALRHLIAVRLVRQVHAADGRTVLFNPNIWVDDSAVVQAALRVEDAKVRAEIGALIEEVAASPGIPEASVTSTSPRWVDFAVSQGLIQRSVVQTSEDVEQRFLFTPHLDRDVFGTARGDPSGHIRQLVGSMVYAATFARIQLRSPAMFVRALVRDGEAGDASPIGTDYPMLETAGIVRVVPGSRPTWYRLQLLQPDVAEGALEILETREDMSGAGRGGTYAEIRGQRSYVHVERERARLAHDMPTDDADAQRLIAALREASRGRIRGS